MAKSKVISHVRLMLFSLGDKMPESVVRKWVKASQLNAERIGEKLKASIPNDEIYKDKVAAASSKSYKKIFHPDFISRKGLTSQEIINRQRENMLRSYEKYRQKLERMYGKSNGDVAGLYKKRIEEAEGHFASGAGRKVVPISGSGASNTKSLLTVAVEWLTDDPKLEGHLRGGDEMIKGNAVMICRARVRSSFRAALAQRLQQAGTAIIDGNYAVERMKQQNDLTNAVVNKFVDPGLNLVEFETEGDSYVNYVVISKGPMFLEIKVSEK